MSGGITGWFTEMAGSALGFVGKKIGEGAQWGGKQVVDSLQASFTGNAGDPNNSDDGLGEKLGKFIHGRSLTEIIGSLIGMFVSWKCASSSGVGIKLASLIAGAGVGAVLADTLMKSFKGSVENHDNASLDVAKTNLKMLGPAKHAPTGLTVPSFTMGH